MTDAERLADIRARHWKVGGAGTVYPEQCVCGLAWPCDAAFLLTEIERLRGVVEAAKAWSELDDQFSGSLDWVFKDNTRPRLAKLRNALRDALAELEANP